MAEPGKGRVFQTKKAEQALARVVAASVAWLLLQEPWEDFAAEFGALATDGYLMVGLGGCQLKQ